ncbi:MAG: RNase adapter RapZ [Microbacteriaceae bacterium]|nr:RNase adapter RapZ [Microbacteriaceae bacterium]
MSEESAKFLVVTGMSGAGRSTVAHALEDLRWYVIDNLPPQIMTPLVQLTDRAGVKLPKIAAVVDVRGGDFFHELQSVMEQIRGDVDLRILFLDCRDDVLVKRFEATRRPHPLQDDGTILDGIQAERKLLEPLKEAAEFVIDTSDLNIHQLARKVKELFSDEFTKAIKLSLLSFGFKYGLPSDADIVFDARFIANPYWEPALRELTGNDKAVRDFVLSQPGVEEFLEGVTKTLNPVFEGYIREDKPHATIAIGCTGGKHRSVVIVSELAKLLNSIDGLAVSQQHRDLGRE